MTKFLLAHDLGTSGNKATLFTTDGELVNSITYSYDTHYFNGNWAEQNPIHWWRAVCETNKRLLNGIDKSKIAAISSLSFRREKS
jgi:xylulokinase